MKKKNAKPGRKPATLRVRFHIDPEGEVVAYFPTLFAKRDWEDSTHVCYRHSTGLGSMKSYLPRFLAPATRRQSAPLLHELKAIGYSRLKVERTEMYRQCRYNWGCYSGAEADRHLREGFKRADALKRGLVGWDSAPAAATA